MYRRDTGLPLQRSALSNFFVSHRRRHVILLYFMNTYTQTVSVRKSTKYIKILCPAKKYARCRNNTTARNHIIILPTRVKQEYITIVIVSVLHAAPISYVESNEKACGPAKHRARTTHAAGSRI